MPYALCPMPYAQSYLIFLRKAICRDCNKLYQIDRIDDLFGTKDPECWKTYIPLFIELYVRRSSITALGVV